MAQALIHLGKQPVKAPQLAGGEDRHYVEANRSSERMLCSRDKVPQAKEQIT